MKKLSIITINYNNCNGLKKTIESVVNQTYNDYEYIIIDGGSTDGSIDVIKEYANKIDFWVSEPDKGIFNAMNKGIKKANGEYLNFMNSGDSFHDMNVLKNILCFLKKDIIVGKYIQGDLASPWGHLSTDVSMIDFVKGGISHAASFIKKDLFTNNLYDETLKISADWKFFIDALIFRNSTFENINIVVANFDDTGISSTNSKLNIYEREKVLKEFLPERIYTDYIRFAKIDSPLLELIPLLNQTYRFNRFIYSLNSTLIKLYFYSKKIIKYRS